MGEIADDMLDGTTCSLCGMFFSGEHGKPTPENPDELALHTHGYPVVCWDCWRALSKRDRHQYQRALRPTL